MRVLEQRFGWNAAPQQARAAERFLLLDDGGLQSELRRADRRDVAARAGANHDHVVFVGHGASFYRFNEERGTNAVAPGGGPASTGDEPGSGSRRLTRARSCPCS